MSGEVLAWLSVWNVVQIFAYGPADATATHSLAPAKSSMGLPFRCCLTQVVLEKKAVKRL